MMNDECHQLGVSVGEWVRVFWDEHTHLQLTIHLQIDLLDVIQLATQRDNRILLLVYVLLQQLHGHVGLSLERYLQLELLVQFGVLFSLFGQFGAQGLRLLGLLLLPVLILVAAAVGAAFRVSCRLSHGLILGLQGQQAVARNGQILLHQRIGGGQRFDLSLQIANGGAEIRVGKRELLWAAHSSESVYTLEMPIQLLDVVLLIQHCNHVTLSGSI